MADRFPQMRRLTSPEALRARLGELGVELPVDDAVDPEGALAAPLPLTADAAGLRLANRLAVLPMEGWDGTPDGRPTELVERRWRRFGESGASLVWGGEAVAVRPDGRANPHQLSIGPHSAGDLGRLRSIVDSAHGAAAGGAVPVVGLQLTHSGRWARPDGSPHPRVAYRHPLLDERVGVDAAAVLTDGELDDLVGDFARAGAIAAEAGFDFVDVKHCHGYLLHELLSAHDRPGRYGGGFEGRTRFLREVVGAIRAAAPGLAIGVRLSMFDVTPHVPGPGRVGVPAADGPYAYAFGGDGTGGGIDLRETHRFVELMGELGLGLLCVTAASPYWAPHVQRPAYFPPSDGYLPPADPLVEVARMQEATRALAAAHPGIVVVGSGLTYLQEWFGHVAQPLVGSGWMSVAGLGRMMLSDPHLPARLLAGEGPDRRLLCRTFSDCTTAPRNGLVSGCWPLDEHYRTRPDRARLVEVKRGVPKPGSGRAQ